MKHRTETERLERDYKGYSAIDRQEILELIDNDSLTVYFQPIFSSKSDSIYGYEALTRIKGENPSISTGELFKKAISTGIISLLDVRCRENAMKEASVQGIDQNNTYLFINICPETLMDPAHRAGITDEFVEEYGISKEKVVLELTEETCIKDYHLFTMAIVHYRKRGYKIAIDDFGSGYGGLKMLSVIEPDFVKIDRYFISNIDRATVKFKIVNSITTTCHKMGIKVIAEGIETGKELKAVSDLGVELLQGYYIGKPSPFFNIVDKVIMRDGFS